MTDHPTVGVRRLDPQRSALLLIDLQERLVPVMHEKTTVVRRAARLVEGANVLGVPVLITEQYPRGLGHTVADIAKQLRGAVSVDEKTRFSASGPGLTKRLEQQGTRSVVLAGIETHVCVLQTALDLLAAGYTVAVCEDATSSRRAIDKRAALQRLAQAGAVPATVEAVLFELLGDADSPKFRALQAVIRS
ncbi:MAG: hydrolase [Planctomycetota bacterium]